MPGSTRRAAYCFRQHRLGEVVCRYYGIPEEAPGGAETHAPAQASGREAGLPGCMNTAGGMRNHTYAALDLDALLGGM